MLLPWIRQKRERVLGTFVGQNGAMPAFQLFDGSTVPSAVTRQAFIDLKSPAMVRAHGRVVAASASLQVLASTWPKMTSGASARAPGSGRFGPGADVNY